MKEYDESGSDEHEHDHNPENNLNQFNYLAIELLEKVGVADPSQDHIDIIEEIISTCGIQAHLVSQIIKRR